MQEQGKTEPEASPSSATKPAEGQQRIPSEALLGPSGELLIEHRGRAYRLRVTQNGKLILTA